MSSTATKRILLVGLGNLPLPRTRHSIGHYILDSLTERFGYDLALNEKLNGYIADGEVSINNRPAHLYLFKPRPLMNVLGQAVGKAMRNTVEDPQKVIVIQDDLNFEPTRLRIKYGGNPDGHRGIRSVSKFLHTQDYFRLKVGIGKAGTAREYVLGPLSAYEKLYFGVDGKGTDEVWRAVEKIVQRMEMLKKTPPYERWRYENESEPV